MRFRVNKPFEKGWIEQKKAKVNTTRTIAFYAVAANFEM